MALIVKDRVKESTTSTGTGTITLAGSPTGFRTFADIGNGNTTYYTIAGGAEFEVGIGTYTASGTTLSRDTVLSNSLGTTAKINFSAGSKDVFCTYPSGKALLGTTGAVASTGTGSVVLSASPTISGNVNIGTSQYGSFGFSTFISAGTQYNYFGTGKEVTNYIGVGSDETYLGSTTYIDGEVNFLGNVVTQKDITVNGVTVGKGYTGIATNLALGVGALSNSSTSGTNNIGIGTNALSVLGEGSTNIAIGHYAMPNTSYGFGNIAIGYAALSNNVSGSNNVAIGNVFTGTGDVNDCIGIGAGLGGTYTSTTGIGSGIAQSTNALNSVFIGAYAGGALSTSNNTVIIGAGAVSNAGGSSGEGSIAIGTEASYSSDTAITTVIGFQAFYNATHRGNGSTAIGYQSLYSSGIGSASTTLATSNTAIGHKTLYANTTGRNNTALGHQAGWGSAGTNACTTGLNNIYIGYQTVGSNSTNSNEIVIGASAVGLGSNSVVLGNTSVNLTQLRGVIYGTNYTVGSLPTATVGARAFVTDALSPVFGSAVVTGGSVPVPVYHDGTIWRVG